MGEIFGFIGDIGAASIQSSSSEEMARMAAQGNQAAIAAQMQMFYSQKNDVNNAVNAALGYWKPNDIAPTWTPPPQQQTPTGPNQPSYPANTPGYYSRQNLPEGQAPLPTSPINLPDLSGYDFSHLNTMRRDPVTGNYTYQNPTTGEWMDLGPSGSTSQQYDAQGNVIQPGQPGYNTDLQGAQRGALNAPTGVRQPTWTYDPNGPLNPQYGLDGQRGAVDSRYNNAESQNAEFARVSGQRGPLGYGQGGNQAATLGLTSGDRPPYQPGQDGAPPTGYGSPPPAPSQGGQWIPGDLERYYDPSISLMQGVAAQNAWAYPEAQKQYGNAAGVSNRASQLLANPSQVWNTPGMQDEFKTGMRAMQEGFSKSMGGGVSGRTMVAAQDYGRMFTREALDRELDLMTREQGMFGQNLANLGPFIDQGYGANVNAANLMAQRGLATANIRVGGPAQMAGLAGMTGANIAQLNVNAGNAWGQNAINQGNIWGNLSSNMGNQAGRLTQYYGNDYGQASGWGGGWM